MRLSAAAGTNGVAGPLIYVLSLILSHCSIYCLFFFFFFFPVPISSHSNLLPPTSLFTLLWGSNCSQKLSITFLFDANLEKWISKSYT